MPARSLTLGPENRAMRTGLLAGIFEKTIDYLTYVPAVPPASLPPPLSCPPASPNPFEPGWEAERLWRKELGGSNLEPPPPPLLLIATFPLPGRLGQSRPPAALPPAPTPFSAPRGFGTQTKQPPLSLQKSRAPGPRAKGPLALPPSPNSAVLFSATCPAAPASAQLGRQAPP